MWTRFVFTRRAALGFCTAQIVVTFNIVGLGMSSFFSVIIFDFVPSVIKYATLFWFAIEITPSKLEIQFQFFVDILMKTLRIVMFCCTGNSAIWLPVISTFLRYLPKLSLYFTAILTGIYEISPFFLLNDKNFLAPQFISGKICYTCGQLDA